MENYHLINTLIITRVTEFIIPFNKQVTVKYTELYRLKIGFLIYLTTPTRLDIIYGVSALLYFLLNPSLQYMKAVNSML